MHGCGKEKFHCMGGGLNHKLPPLSPHAFCWLALICIQRKRSEKWNKTFYAFYLFFILHQNVFKFLHHLIIDSLSGSNVFEVQQHIKSTLSRSQRLEWLINKHLCFPFNGFHLFVEMLHLTFPRVFVLNLKWIKSHFLKRLDKVIDSKQDFFDSFGISCDCFQLRSKNVVKFL